MSDTDNGSDEELREELSSAEGEDGSALDAYGGLTYADGGGDLSELVGLGSGWRQLAKQAARQVADKRALGCW